MEFIYRCTDCEQSYEISPDIMVCPSCLKKQKEDEPLRGVLEVELTGQVSSKFEVFDLLPVEKEYFANIPVGNTPLWASSRVRKQLGLPNLYIKDDSTNPSKSFKDRASFLVSAFAKKHNVNEIILASTGNAGSSMACIGAAAEQDITIFLPKAAPPAKMVQALQYGAKVVLVDGNYDMAYDFSLEYSKTKKGLNRNTAYNPMTLEGKKTVSLEIFQQLGKAPDNVLVPTGDGCIIGGVFKGFKDLLKLKLIDKMPTIIAVQAEGSDAIARAFNDGHFTNKPTQTVADSICVDIPRNGYYALNHLKEYNGKCVTVSDNEILQAQRNLSMNSGLFTEPAGAAAYAGLLKIKDQLDPSETTVVLATGSGLKDVATAQKILPKFNNPIKHLKELLI